MNVNIERHREEVLRVSGLQTYFSTEQGTIKAVNGVDFALRRGEILGLVGESGSGKSVTGFSIMGLIDPPGKIHGGSIRLGETELVGLSEKSLRPLRGVRMAMIFQDPMMTLNPVMRVADQMIEAITVHERVPRKQAMLRAREALVKAGIPAPDERLRAYPHELSGGMRQRVAIATAILHRPDVIIADEPTTALDVTIQGQILAEVQRLARDEGVALVWITHDLSVVAGLADRICVMYAGRVVESGATDQVLDHPAHPYTLGLIESLPGQGEQGKPLKQIPGMTPSLLGLDDGCAFRNRCAYASEVCRTPPRHQCWADGQTASCFHPRRAIEHAAAQQEVSS
ncbi:ABC transporter ATP-binding protein [Brenneria izadpanahii]|uniref:ABC-type dipeptide transporter n=1 Tax=Brenneria izadpanahii TaxID=2722756 RepID=A0ABX7UT82_9GAMM|nr:ABC transporter ATP-binding protein [Brenneria izadpanahii]QTF08515.1 ABC transporter ATP-binding protein [Brenneria izadpanahii]